MPCFNAAGTVSRAIQSIRRQTFSNWELIIIDDGSDDESALEARRASGKDPRIQLHRIPHQGVVAASHIGYSHAQADIIARMDADDVSRPTRFEQQLNSLQRQPELDAVSCLARFAGDLSAARGYARHVDWANQCQSPEQIALNRFIDLPVPHPTLMYRRALVEDHGYYHDGTFPEDYELFLRWLSAGARIGKVPEVLFDWHDPPSRLSRNDSRYAMQAFHQCKAPHLARAIRQAGAADRDLWIVGAGRPARKSARPLEQAWKKASGFIDIDPRKIGRSIHGQPVVSPDQLPPTQQSLIVSYVGTRGARELIRQQLVQAGRLEGLDFWIAA